MRRPGRTARDVRAHRRRVARTFDRYRDNDEIDFCADFVILSARCNREQEKHEQNELSDCPYLSPHSNPSSL